MVSVEEHQDGDERAEVGSLVAALVQLRAFDSGLSAANL